MFTGSLLPLSKNIRQLPRIIISPSGYKVFSRTLYYSYKWWIQPIPASPTSTVDASACLKVPLSLPGYAVLNLPISLDQGPALNVP